jgi:hypothetical protein
VVRHPLPPARRASTSSPGASELTRDSPRIAVPYLPREVFLTLAVFFGGFGDSFSGDPAAAALSFCFLVAIGVINPF